MVASVIEKDGDVLGFGIGFSHFFEKDFDGFFVTVFFGDEGDNIKIDHVESSQNIEPSSASIRWYLFGAYFPFLLPLISILVVMSLMHGIKT